MSVAIRTAVRIQDQDDAPTLGAGQNGYALTWDNASGAFVATALFTGGLLATGATTGATSQAQAFTNGVVTPFNAPAADSGTAWQVRKADKTTAVITVDTTNARVRIGGTPEAEVFAVNGNIQFAQNGYIGYRLSFDTTVPVLRSFGSATTRVYTGATSGKLLLIAEPSGGLDIATFDGLNFRFGIGTTSPATCLHSLLTSAVTNAVSNVVTIGHDTSGTAAAGFGAGLLFALKSSTTAAQSAAGIQAIWYEATDATRKADLVLTAYDTAEREGLRIRGAGSEPAIGFYGVAPIARAVLATGAGATVDNVITALQNLGLVKQS